MASGYMLRVDQARADRQAKPCKTCKHPMGGHLNLPYELYEITDGTEIRVTKNPDYRANEFHCRVEGCDCKITTP